MQAPDSSFLPQHPSSVEFPCYTWSRTEQNIKDLSYLHIVLSRGLIVPQKGGCVTACEGRGTEGVMSALVIGVLLKTCRVLWGPSSAVRGWPGPPCRRASIRSTDSSRPCPEWGTGIVTLPISDQSRGDAFKSLRVRQVSGFPCS